MLSFSHAHIKAPWGDPGAILRSLYEKKCSRFWKYDLLRNIKLDLNNRDVWNQKIFSKTFISNFVWLHWTNVLFLLSKYTLKGQRKKKWKAVSCVKRKIRELNHSEVNVSSICVFLFSYTHLWWLSHFNELHILWWIIYTESSTGFFWCSILVTYKKSEEWHSAHLWGRTRGWPGRKVVSGTSPKERWTVT